MSETLEIQASPSDTIDGALKRAMMILWQNERRWTLARAHVKTLMALDAAMGIKAQYGTLLDGGIPGDGQYAHAPRRAERGLVIGCILGRITVLPDRSATDASVIRILCDDKEVATLRLEVAP